LGSAAYLVLGFSSIEAENPGLNLCLACSIVQAMNNASRTETKAGTGLHVCPECTSKLVQPTRWEQTAKRGHWRLWRRCPECEWRCDGIHGENEIDAFDEALDDGAEALAAELAELERESMRHVVEAFSTALQTDLITADDFRAQL
jgi:enoyl-CoA hydratase/carnithine racemase